MTEYQSLSKEELSALKGELEEQYREFQALDLNLNMARGKPSTDQLDLSLEMLDGLNSESCFFSSTGDDCRNYGLVDGLPEMRAFFGELLDVPAENVIVGGNSSLNMMFDAISCAYISGFDGCAPWGKQEKVKFLCPVPGYDRHFAICEYFGIEMIPVPLTETGPDMDMVEKLVSEDESIKGIWCVPKYSNPSGVTYSDETVRRFAALRPAAPDFKIFWDNAYCIHELTDTPEVLLNLFEECKKQGSENMVITFCSTSKITFPGSGVAAMASGEKTLATYRRHLSYQTIGPDKINQLRHIRFFKHVEGLKEHMEKHRAILQPRFASVLNALEKELSGLGIAQWSHPKGGYFVSVDVLPGCAKRVVQLCKEGGVTLTGAGATFPYKKDPNDTNIRLAPSFPPVIELKQAMNLFCICVKLAAAEKLLGE
ncbi:MAG: aminotransferase class I/II-fold pyridoxal phosphate-dependent enzyme [Oscillospiraceae bacterium]|nr:aminotransferase class I/II-fold pyridoxal phosphate-dependent enzyme [Oscillospiraceae bacterium]